MTGLSHPDAVSDPWRRDVADFIQAHLPPSPAGVLDVGCGDGWLCHRLERAGYEARGIDPGAPDDPLLTPVGLDDFDHRDGFDAVVAVLSLHHMPDVDGAVEKIADLLAPAGIVVVVEFAWDRFDDRTARWCLERLPAQLDEENWLHERCARLRERERRGDALRASDLMHRWAAEEGFHSSSSMLASLRGRFSERTFGWSPYLYPDLPEVTAEQERAAIDAGEVAPTGFRFVGRLV